ncbi:hypothetical protein SKAU_G00392480 [Synaphobranchus kaupii]|uniref:Uncharacterized protein n=1 Tax=Synaphobranchus kaupii TaxID=118154 RepID=A0A9Q1EBV0_SYNKA|nr:hypothetical protein SKAU_G00392480 [Synaphobranchus kaupii]
MCDANGTRSLALSGGGTDPVRLVLDWPCSIADGSTGTNSHSIGPSSSSGDCLRSPVWDSHVRQTGLALRHYCSFTEWLISPV